MAAIPTSASPTPSATTEGSRYPPSKVVSQTCGSEDSGTEIEHLYKINKL